MFIFLFLKEIEKQKAKIAKQNQSKVSTATVIQMILPSQSVDN